ncbi:MAG: heparinase II/III family protein [Sphingomonas sp.]
MTGERAIDTAADGIEKGKRLIRTGSGQGLSLAERLSDRLQWLTWRSPLHNMRLKGRQPLKLIVVPDEPFIGDVRRGKAVLGGNILLRGEALAIAALDFANLQCSRQMVDHLHSFGWLRDLSTVATRAQGAPIAEAIMRKWLAAHAEDIAEPAWRPDYWGRRITAWATHAPLILSSADLDYRSAVLGAFARGARHLDRSADKAPAGPSRVAAWCGVVTAGLLIPGGDVRRKAGEAGLSRAIAASIFADGGVVARAPMAQIDVICQLTALREAYAARRLVPPPLIEATLARMVPVLLGLCHGDHGLSSWQGGGPVSGEEIDRIVAATGIRARPARQTREWGYQRLVAGRTLVIIDAAPPPIARLAEGGCASTLAFEFSDGADRVFVNCGGARMVVAQVPAALAEGLRTTAAHSTLVVGDSNSTAIYSDGTLGRGVAEVELSRQETDAATRIEASHDGYARRFGFVHRRQLVLASDGRELRGEDTLLPTGKRRKQGMVGFALRFHLGARVDVSPTADGQAALLRLPGGALWQFRCRGGALSIEQSLWIDAMGIPQSTHQLVVTAQAPAGGASVSWALKRAA